MLFTRTHSELYSRGVWPVSMLCLSHWCSYRAVKIKLPCWFCVHIKSYGHTEDTVFFVFADWLQKLRERWGNKASLISAPLCSITCRHIFNSSSEFPHPLYPLCLPLSLIPFSQIFFLNFCYIFWNIKLLSINVPSSCTHIVCSILLYIV